MRDRKKDGFFLKCKTKDNKISQVSFVPTHRNDDNLVEILLLDEKKANEIANKAISLSEPYGTQFSIKGNR